jgi:uncharacterized tellurite resistance protein B-like protein
MLKAIKDFVEKAFAEQGAEDDKEHALRLATAALLVEMARADFEERRLEHDAMRALLQEHFALSAEESGTLLEEAGKQADSAVSLHEFTQVLHRRLSEGEKLRVIEMLWRVALADADLDRHENHLVRKVGDLLYVSRSDLMRLKHQVTEEAKEPE